jgi:tetratricopeptide (TPR) repeat protein
MKSVLVHLGMLVLVAGCSDSRLCPCPDKKVLDKELMLLLSSARSLHHQADLYLQQGDVEQAIATVQRILKLKLDSKWAEAEEARLDASARLAKLLLGQDKEEEALQAVASGITGARRQSFYLSNLHSVRGEILQHRSKRLDEAGEKASAKQAAREAIAAFEQSISINQSLQKELLRRGKQ